MWMILQAPEPEDWVIATGVTTSVRDLVQMAFAELGIALEFRGKGKNEKGVVAACEDSRFQLKAGTEVVAIDPRYFRPTEVDLLIGDATKAREKLGWEPEYTLQQLVAEMVAADLEGMQKELHLKNGGYKVLNYNE
jgi:GDPmannose 4,6-dehydratase